MNPNNSWFVKKHFQVPCQFVWGTLHMLNWLKLSSIKTFLPTLIACDKKVRVLPALLLREKIGCHATLSGAETLAQQCLLSIVFKKSSGANSNCQKSMLRKTWISAERVFTNQPTCLWQCFVFVFLRDGFFPLLSQPGLFFKIFHSDWCFHGDIRPPVSASWTPPSQPADGFTGGFHWWNGVYIYDQQPLLLKQRYIYICFLVVFLNIDWNPAVFWQKHPARLSYLAWGQVRYVLDGSGWFVSCWMVCRRQMDIYKHKPSQSVFKHVSF